MTSELFYKHESFTNHNTIIKSLVRDLFEKLEQANMRFNITIRKNAISLKPIDNDKRTFITIWFQKTSIAIEIGRKEDRKRIEKTENIEDAFFSSIQEKYNHVR